MVLVPTYPVVGLVVALVSPNLLTVSCSHMHRRVTLNPKYFHVNYSHVTIRTCSLEGHAISPATSRLIYHSDPQSSGNCVGKFFRQEPSEAPGLVYSLHEC